MKRPVITFDEPTHSYTVNGIAVPSVTTVISGVLGTGYDGVPDAEYYMGRGKAVHACAALVAQGVEFEHDHAISGFVLAVRKFFADFKPQPIAVETPVGSARYRYAGTFDLLAKIDRRHVLIDWKSSLEEKRCILQLAGYAIAQQETLGECCSHGMGVWLRNDGTYKTTGIKPLAVECGKFLNVLSVYGIMRDMGVLRTV